MRLISQNRNVDVSYENVSLIHKDNEIVAITNHNTPNGVYEFTMGKYSTKEKAYKVMEMVKNIYMNGNIIGRTISNIFIFPKDEDVGV